MVNRHRDGHHYTEEQTISPVRDEGGRITHFVAVKQDVTERRRMEEGLRAANERLRRSSPRSRPSRRSCGTRRSATP